MKKYKIEIKIIDIEKNKGPVISLPFDMVQEAKTDILKELIEATIVEMEKDLKYEIRNI